MKLRSLELFYFLKHQHKLVEFLDDVNVIRGANEAGKSSIVEGFGYLLSGTAALAESLDDSINWDAPAKSKMKVIGVIEHQGKSLTVTRGTSGASVANEKGEPIVTGHKPVTEYLENLFSLPAGRAHHVMLASQNEIRGVLALGPAAASEFIERLADFTEIDQLIRKAKAELPSGDTRALEALVAQSKEEADSLVLPDTIDNSIAIEALRKEYDNLTSSIGEIEDEVALRNMLANEARFKSEQLCNGIKEADKEAMAATKKAEYYRALLAEQDSLYAREEELNTLFLAHQTRVVASEIKSLPAPAAVWEGSIEELDAELEKLTSELSELKVTTAGRRSSLKAEKDKLLTSEACPTCGHILNDPAEVAKHNAKIQATIDDMEQRLKATLVSQLEIEEDLGSMRSIKVCQSNLMNSASNWPLSMVEFDKSTVPFGVKFVGKLAEEPVDIEKAERDLAEVEAKLLELDAKDCEQELATYEALANSSRDRAISLQKERAGIIMPEVYTRADEIAGLKASRGAKGDEIKRLQEEQNQSQNARAMAESSKKAAERTLEINSAALAEARYNNEFIKALKLARKQVNDKIWGVVLAGVSDYFSKLRGVPSVITKAEKGFLVDGKRSRPSGSTLDVLGLALRIVIAKMFTNSGLLVVDEPTANCDQERIANVAAVMQASGFDQIIWVSHDDLSEALPGNLIEL